MSGDMNDRLEVSQEMLMAYVDGQLSAEDAGRVARAIAADPALAADAAVYQTTRRVLAEGFAGALDPVVPEHLRALVMSRGAIKTAPENAPNLVSLRRQPRRPPSPWLQQPWKLAAAAALLVGVGLVVGVTAGPRLSGGGASFASLVGPLPSAHPLATALETAPSAKTVASRDTRILPVQTFVSASGDICREFEFSVGADGGVGVACRNDAGWSVQAMFAAPTQADPGGGFRVASGVDPAGFDAVFEALDASDGFEAEVEACLLERKWVDASVCLPASDRR